jgi:hypothetical protein
MPQHLDLDVDASKLVVGPASQGVVDRGVDPHEDVGT